MYALAPPEIVGPYRCKVNSRRPGERPFMRVAAPDDGLTHADLIPLQIAFAKLAVQQTLYSDFMHHRWNASSVGSFSVRFALSMTFEGFSTTVS